MAGQSAAFDVIEEVPTQRFETLRLSEILTPDLNLAEILTEEVVIKIGQDAIRDVELDLSSCKDWRTRYQRWMDMAMQVREAKNFPWPKAANVKYPLLTVASIQFQARAYPAIVDGSNLVKGRVLGPDPDGQKRARADRIGQHMTWQLLFRMPGWEEETDRLLLALPIVGCVFRKTYHDTVQRVNVSEMVAAEDFIIDYWAKSLDSAPRYTHVLKYYPHEIREKIVSGLWLEVRAEPEQENADDADSLRTFYEQHRNIDLDGDGYPEPYVVTCTKQGKVARIVPCFGPDEVTVIGSAGIVKLSEIPQGGEAAAEEIVRIERRQYFTKYSFIPSPDGSFYDIGFGWLLEDISAPINSSINAMLDAAALQNAGGGFISSAVNTRGGEMRFRLGEWKRIDVAGPLNQAIYPLPAAGPSAVLFNLLTFLVAGAKEITSVSEIMTGTDQRVIQPTTLLAMIQEGQKVMNAVHKRVHRAFGGELRILRRLNRDFLEEEEYFQLNDNEAGQVGREDYADADLDVMPVSDPNMVSDILKMSRSDAEWSSFNGDPLINQVVLRRNRLEALGSKNIKEMLEVPAPPPDPKTVLEMVKEARAKLESEAKVRASDVAAATSLIDAAQAAYDIGLMEDAATLAEMALRLGSEAVEPTDNGNTQPGSIPGMDGQPPDAGILPPGGEPQAIPDGAMGGGDAGGALPGIPGAGEALGPAGGDELG